mgnify:CR=1 FL=1
MKLTQAISSILIRDILNLEILGENFQISLFVNPLNKQLVPYAIGFAIQSC